MEEAEHRWEETGREHGGKNPLELYFSCRSLKNRGCSLASVFINIHRHSFISEPYPNSESQKLNPTIFTRKEGSEDLLELAEEGLFLAVGGR